jgi:putative DNA primase/helicase
MTTFEDLKKLDQWVCWKNENKGGKMTKVPYQVNGDFAKSNDSRTWNSHDACVRAVKVMDYDGVGFVFTSGDSYVGVDIDDCITDEGIHPKAIQIITHLNSYAEISPSETGVKIWVKDENKIADLRKKKFEIAEGMTVEVYREGRYFTVTNNVLDLSTEMVVEAGAELNEIIDMYVSKESNVFDDGEYDSIPDGEENFTETECEAYLKNQVAIATYRIKNMKDGDKHRTRYIMGRLVGGAVQAVRNAGYQVSAVEYKEIIDTLYEVNPPNDNHEQERKAIYDGMQAGANTPTRIRKIAQATTREVMELHADDESMVSRINKYYNGLHNFDALSDLYLADLFIHLFSDTLRYNSETLSWYRWKGNIWARGKQKSRNIPISLSAKMLDALHEYGMLIPDDKVRAKYLAAVSRHMPVASCEAIVKMAESIITEESESDKQSKGFFDEEKSREFKDYVTVGNGIVNLTNGELLPFNKEWCFTRMTNIEYTPGKRSERFEQFINQIFLGKKDLINYVQYALGYSMTGRSGIQALFFCVGNGQNGKSTLFEILDKVYGGYHIKTDTKAFILDLKTSSNGANPFVAEMMDRRLVVGDEYPKDTQLDNALIKNVTGSTTLRARFNYGNPIAFKPTHTMWFLSNYLPEMKQQDNGIWRRFKIIPFLYEIPEHEKKEMNQFIESFNNELSGILSWVVEGAIKVIADGKLPDCAIVEQLNDEFRMESDRFLDFLKTCCDVDRTNAKDYWVSKKLAYQVWDMWKDSVGDRMVVTAKSFSREITSKRSGMGFTYGKRNDDYFLGFRIKPEYLRNIYDDVEKLNGFGRKDLDEEPSKGFKSNIVQMPARNLPIQLDDVADDTF